MAQIKNIEGLSVKDIVAEVEQGGKFVVFQYCISVIFLTFKRPSDVYFVRSTEKPLKHGAQYVLISLFLGWWGIPWGPIYTITSLVTNLSGGKDVTMAVLQSYNASMPTVQPVESTVLDGE